MQDLWIDCNLSSFTMTKSNSKKRSLNSKKEHPGCMGGFFSFFDFHQHASSRKLISDKAHADGVAGSRNSLDVPSESLKNPESRDAKNENQVRTYDPRKNASTKKKAGGLPIKTLIAEEMSKELEPKQRTPGVVARLMGLEAMPAEAVLGDHSQELVGDPQICMFGKQQQQPKTTRDGCSSPQKTRVSASKSTQEIFSPASQQKTVNSPEQRVLPCTQAQLHEKQREDLKKESGASQAIKFQDFPNTQRLDELTMQSVEKHMLVDETLDEAKMALVRQKFIDAKNLATDEKQQQSKEFFDALEVLQSNKDLFLKFLKEPNSLFSKHLQDLQSTLQTPEVKKTKIKSANVMKTAEELKMEDTGHGNYSAEYNKHDKLHHQKQKGPRFLTGQEEEWRVRSSSSGTKDKSRQNFTANAPGKNDFCSLPTRIVVLKPGPGSGLNVKPQSPPSWSPRSQTAFRNMGEGDRVSNRDFIQEVRERLKLGLKENSKDDCKITQDGHQGQIHDGARDPREIARDIARQVRETVTIDLTSGHSEVGKVSTSFTNLIGKGNSLDQSIMSSGELDLSSETPVMKDSLNSTKRLSAPTSQPPSKSHPVESAISKEAKKRLSQRLKLSHAEEGKQDSKGNSSTLGKMLALKENKRLNCGPNKSKHNAMNDGECQQSSRQDRYEFGTDCTYLRDGDENTHILTESCAKSHVIANSDESNEDKQCRISNVLRDDAHEMLVDSSSLTGSFLMTGGRFSNMKSNSLKEMVTNLPIHLDVVCDTPKEVHVDLESCKGMVEDMNSLEGEGSHKQSTDTPYMESKQFKVSCDIDSDASPTDNNDCEEKIFQPLDICASLRSDALQSEDQTDCATKVPEQPTVCSPTFCSPTKQSPHLEFKASTVTNEKAEQPSPVSVLDSPFQEETPSPKGFKEISSDLQELRLRLRLLKFDGSERPTSKVDNGLQEDEIVSEGHVPGEVDIFSERTCNSPSEAIITPASKLPIAENLDFKYLEVDDISCPKDRQSALCYVRDVLEISGFFGDGIFAKWYLANHPLDPSLFEKIENFHGYDSEVDKTEAHESEWERRLLFDSVNDVLLQILGPFFNQHPWLKDYKLSIQRKPAGKQLLRDTWARISRDLYTQAESGETLEGILAKDMAKGGQWMELQNDVEAVGCQVERAIFSDLIDEAIFDLVS